MIELNKNESVYEMNVAGRLITAVTHIGAHAEEIYCILLLSVAGQKCERMLEFLDTYAPDNAIFFGVRKGPFDEHPPYATSEEEAKKKDACALTLFVEALKEFGFDAMKVPTVKVAVQHLLMMDSHARANALDMSNIIKEMNRYYRDHNMEPRTVEWAFKGFLAKLHEDPNSPRLTNFNIDYIGQGLMKRQPDIFPDPETGQRWYNEAWEAHHYSHTTLFENAAREYKEKVVSIREKDARDIRSFFERNKDIMGFRMTFTLKRRLMGDINIPLVYVQSDNTKMAQYARFKEARKAQTHAAVFIQKNSSDQYYITFDTKRYGIEADGVIALLRNAVRKMKGLNPLPIQDAMLYEPGESADVPELFYMKKDTESIMNGSETHPYVDPLPLSPVEVVLCAIRGTKEARKKDFHKRT